MFARTPQNNARRHAYAWVLALCGFMLIMSLDAGVKNEFLDSLNMTLREISQYLFSAPSSSCDCSPAHQWTADAGTLDQLQAMSKTTFAAGFALLNLSFFLSQIIRKISGATFFHRHAWESDDVTSADEHAESIPG
jgi:hypothetical protein